MGDGFVEVLGLTLCASLVTAGVCSRQQDEGKRSSPEQAKVSIPKQGDYQEQRRQRLQAQAKQILMPRRSANDLETAQAQAPPLSSTTVLSRDWNRPGQIWENSMESFDNCN